MFYMAEVLSDCDYFLIKTDDGEKARAVFVGHR